MIVSGEGRSSGGGDRATQGNSGTYEHGCLNCLGGIRPDFVTEYPGAVSVVHSSHKVGADSMEGSRQALSLESLSAWRVGSGKR